MLKTIPLIGDFLHRIAIGGGEACASGLLRMYVWHIFGLTFPVIILGIWHAFRVRRDGGIAVPPPQARTDNTRISRNELVRREVLAMFVVSLALILLSSFVPAPIAPAMPTTPAAIGAAASQSAKAPWFFLWVQQMLKWGDPFIFGILVPLGILTLVALIPYIFPKPADADIGTWFPKSNRLAQVTITLVVLTVIILTLLANAN